MEGSSYFLRADRGTGSAGLFLSHCHGGICVENIAGKGFPGWILPNSPFSGEYPPSPSVSYAEGTPFSPGMRKGGKRIR